MCAAAAKGGRRGGSQRPSGKMEPARPMLTARRLQRTIARETELRGVGFIFGTDVAMRFRPAKADQGVVFVRTDLPERPSVRAHIRNVIPRQRRTTIQQGAASVEMVEH